MFSKSVLSVVNFPGFSLRSVDTFVLKLINFLYYGGEVLFTGLVSSGSFCMLLALLSLGCVPENYPMSVVTLLWLRIILDSGAVGDC